MMATLTEGFDGNSVNLKGSIASGAGALCSILAAFKYGIGEVAPIVPTQPRQFYATRDFASAVSLAGVIALRRISSDLADDSVTSLPDC
jgi:hypothetical protein